MKLLHVAALVLIAAQENPPAPEAVELYPPVRNATVVHAFGLPQDVKADVVRKALADLSTKDADCAVRYGPVSSASRPQKAFVIVEAPASVDQKDVVKALKKGAALVEPMVWTCFANKDLSLGAGMGGGIPGLSPRDFILGISNDLRWVEARGGFGEFFYAPGKLDAEYIEDRFNKLAQPFGMNIGKVVVDKITWSLAPPIDAAAAKRVEKEIGKLAGVKSVKLDPEKHVLEVMVSLEGLARSGPPIALPQGTNPLGEAGATAEAAPRMRFDTNALFVVLDKEKLNLAAPAKESEPPGGK